MGTFLMTYGEKGEKAMLPEERKAIAKAGAGGDQSQESGAAGGPAGLLYRRENMVTTRTTLRRTQGKAIEIMNSSRDERSETYVTKQ
jgi:hypothetical protein